MSAAVRSQAAKSIPDPKKRPIRSQVIDLGREYERSAAEVLAKYASRAYALGVDKARVQAGRKGVTEAMREQYADDSAANYGLDDADLPDSIRDSPYKAEILALLASGFGAGEVNDQLSVYADYDPITEDDAAAVEDAMAAAEPDLAVGAIGATHDNELAGWYIGRRGDLGDQADDLLSWYDDNPDATGEDVRGRLLDYSGLAGLGLWSLYQTGFRNELADQDAEGFTEPVMVNFVDVGDENTCDSCRAAAEGSPYPADEAPIPGPDTCEGDDRCRCELQVVGADETAAAEG